MIGVSHIGIAAGCGGGGVSINPDFVSTWDTTQAGSASDTVVLPLLSGGTYSGTIDWGDGNTSALSYANRTHTYAAGGTYTITISGSDIQGWRFARSGDRRKIIDISNWGNLTITTNEAFYGCTNLNVSATDAPNITTTSFSSMFRECTVFNSDISHWDISTVTNTELCFQLCQAFDSPLNNWNTSNVTSMANMFYGATLFNQDISGWNTGNVIYMQNMFYGANSFNQDISGWDTSNVIGMNNMFYGANSFNQDISGWNVSNVLRMDGMFRNNNSFNQDISGWNVSNVLIMENMLYNADSFDQDISNWDIDQVYNFVNFMRNATGLSTANYDALLVGWEAQLQAAYPSGAGYTPTISISFGGSQYTLGAAAEAARTSLISTFGWTISDGGGV